MVEYEKIERLSEADDNPFKLGRHVLHDPRNRDFPIREILEAQPPRRRPWYRRMRPFDQGRESSCTGQAAAGVLCSSPFYQAAKKIGALEFYDSPEDRFTLYREAQLHDPWPGGEPDYRGSSTDAPFRVMRDRGHISGWRWCFGLTDVVDTLHAFGTVAVGTRWYRSMFYPDKYGNVKIEGGVVGGHAYHLIWADENDRRIRAINSWGDWGQKGRFWLTYDQLDRLLGEDGEAVTVVLPTAA